MNKKRLDDIKVENFIWIIYLILIALSFYGNKLEKSYFLTGNNQDKETYRKIIILIFSIALIIYFYFFIDSLNSYQELTPYDTKEKRDYTKLNTIASTLILIAGIIFLIIAIKDKNIETEIAFT